MKQLYKALWAGLMALALLLSGMPLCLASGLEEDGYQAVDLLTPTNPHASASAKNLLAYLGTLSGTNRFVTGTFDISNDNEVYNLLQEQFGVEPGLYSCRYFVSPSEGYSYNGESLGFLEFYRTEETNRLLAEHYRNGNILLIHADKPEDYLADYAVREGIDENSRNLVRHLDATNPEKDERLYGLWYDYVGQLIEQLRALEALGVSDYLLRLFVEMNSRPFWGTDEEGWEAFRRVFQQTSDRLKNSGLTGYLLTFAPATDETDNRHFYPGNAYVDLLAPTLYAYIGSKGTLEAKQFADYDWFLQTGKPIGLSETSCRTGIVEKMYAEGRNSWYNTLISMVSYWPAITFVNCWGNNAYSLVNETNGSPQQGNDDGYWYLTSAYSITRDQLPAYRTGTIRAPGVVQVYDQKDFGGNTQDTFISNYVGLEQRVYSRAQLQVSGIDPGSIASFHVRTGYGLRLYEGDNATGVCHTFLSSEANVTALQGRIRSAEVFVPAAVSHEKPIYASDNDEEAWKANDGEYSRWTGHTVADGTGWLMLDLERPCTVHRWKVLHASGAGLLENYDTVAYALQYSTDGNTWVTVDSVTDNSRSVTDRFLPKPIVARYFRLYITDANRITSGADRDLMTVAEWVLYGLESETAAAPSTVTDEESESGDTPPEWKEPEAPADGNLEEGDSSSDGITRKKVVRRLVESYLPVWAIVLIVGGGLLAAGGVVWWILAARRKKRQSDPT